MQEPWRTLNAIKLGTIAGDAAAIVTLSGMAVAIMNAGHTTYFLRRYLSAPPGTLWGVTGVNIRHTVERDWQYRDPRAVDSDAAALSALDDQYGRDF